MDNTSLMKQLVLNMPDKSADPYGLTVFTMTLFEILLNIAENKDGSDLTNDINAIKDLHALVQKYGPKPKDN